MKKALTFTLALCTIALSNAQWKRVKGNGKNVTIKRSVGEYDRVAVAGWFDVELVDGNEGELTLEGESNLLEVEVHKVSANASLEVAERKADFWVFGGIYRPVYLEIVPGDHIDRMAIDARADGSLRADLVFGPGARFSAVRAIVESLEGQPLGEPLMATATGEEGMSLALDQPPRQFAAGAANVNFLIELDGQAAVVIGLTPQRIVDPGAQALGATLRDGRLACGQDVGFDGC